MALGAGYVLTAPNNLLFDRFPLFNGSTLLPTSLILLVNGIDEGPIMLEATQNIAKNVSTIIRDSVTGLGANLTSGLLASLVISIKKGGLTTYLVISPTLTAVGSTGLLDLALTGSHLNTLGVSSINITGPGVLANNSLFIDVIAFNKNDSVRGGMSALPNAAAAASGGLPTVGVTIPDATAGTSSGLPLRQNVDDAASGATTAVNSHTDTVTSGVTSAVNTHTDTATSGATTAVNAHTDAVSSVIVSTIPSVAQVRDAVLNALLQDHATPGSLADGVAIAAGLLQGNFFMDTIVNDGNGQTSARLRLWRDESGVVGATSGGSGEGQFATFQVTTAYTGPGKVSTHKVVRVVGT